MQGRVDGAGLEIVAAGRMDQAREGAHVRSPGRLKVGRVSNKCFDAIRFIV
jgi:hypothetical protein